MSVAAKIPICEADFQEEPIRHRLRRRLLALSYHAFARCLCLLLARLGYEDARPAGRTRWKGHNREGGYDIEAWLPVGITRRRVVVQAKQFDARPVFQRSVDELRGTCLRAGAAEALLITTSAFSSVVQTAPGPSRSPGRPRAPAGRRGTDRPACSGTGSASGRRRKRHPPVRADWRSINPSSTAWTDSTRARSGEVQAISRVAPTA